MTLPTTPPTRRRIPLAATVPRFPGEDWDDEPVFAVRPTTGTARPRSVQRTSAASAAGYRLTERDTRLLAFLARFRLADYGLLAYIADTSYDALRQRMRTLRQAGLVAMHRGSTITAGVWTLTTAGAGLIGSDLPVQEGAPSAGTLRHTLLLARIGAGWEAAGEVVVTEREIRVIDVRGRRGGSNPGPLQYAVRATTTGQDLHIPDLVLEKWRADGTAQHIAVEVELHPKTNPARIYGETLRAYNSAPHIGHVAYVTPSALIARHVAAAARAERMTDHVTVHVVDKAAVM